VERAGRERRIIIKRRAGPLFTKTLCDEISTGDFVPPKTCCRA
jgi:hypothetical protein